MYTPPLRTTFILLCLSFISACGNNNDPETMLTDISIEGGSLQEVFSASTNEYTIDLNAFATSLNINLSPEEGASISAILSTDPDTTEDDIQIPITNNQLDITIEQTSTLTLSISKNNRSSTYTFTVNIAEASSLTQIWGVDEFPLEGQDLSFGYSIDMTNNGSRIAIGIPYYSGTDAEGNEIYASGAALILELNNNNEWDTTFLESPYPIEEDYFGTSIAVEGNMLAIGIPGEDGNAESSLESPNSDSEDSGAVIIYLYNKSTGTWSPSHYIKAATSLEEYNEFGYAVDLWFEDENSAEIAITSGAYSSVEVFKRNVISATADTEASDTFETFGTPFSDIYSYLNDNALELSENYLVIGDWRYATDLEGDSTTETHIGRILIYPRLENGAFSTTATIFSANTEGVHMGRSIAIDGNRVAAGIPRLGNGEVRIYKQTSDTNSDQPGTWELDETITAPNGDGDGRDQFGYSVDLHRNILLVGAINNDGNSETTLESVLDPTASDFIDSSGAVYAFQKTTSSDATSTWEAKAFIKAPDASNDDDFGISVKIAPNGTIAASARFGESYLADPNDETGAVYVYR